MQTEDTNAAQPPPTAWTLTADSVTSSGNPGSALQQLVTPIPQRKYRRMKGPPARGPKNNEIAVYKEANDAIPNRLSNDICQDYWNLSL